MTIGSHALIGDLVCIYDTDFHQVTPDAPPWREAVTVGKNVWIGRGALLLPGAKVGDHAVIAAESVVTGRCRRERCRGQSRSGREHLRCRRFLGSGLTGAL